MIIEALTVLSMLVGGSALLRVAGLRGWELVVLGSIAGVSLYICVGALQVLSPLSSHPVITMSVTAGIPSTLWLWRYFRGHDVRIRVVPTVAIIVGVVGAITILRAAQLVAWSNDSFRYLLNASLIASDNFDSASTALVPKRLIGVPLLHAAANLSGEHYLPSITPLIAGLILAVIAWIGWTALSPRVGVRTSLIVVATGLVLLVSINRFVFHTFYVNGHLLFGALLLSVVGCSWLIATGARINRNALLIVMGLAIVALVFVRAEAPIAVSLALLPLLLDESVTVRTKSVFLALLGISTIAWQGFVAVVYLDEGLSVPFSVSGLVLIGLAILAGIPLLRWKALTQRGHLVLWVAEGGLWLALAVLVIRDPQVLIESLDATFHNVVLGAGGWGISLMTFAGLMAVVAFMRIPAGSLLRFPLTTFIPFALLLAYLREGAYRVGDGDSLNRMWIQIIPIAVVYLVAAIGVGRWRKPWQRSVAAEPTSSGETEHGNTTRSERVR